LPQVGEKAADHAAKRSRAAQISGRGNRSPCKEGGRRPATFDACPDAWQTGRDSELWFDGKNYLKTKKGRGKELLAPEALRRKRGEGDALSPNLEGAR